MLMVAQTEEVWPRFTTDEDDGKTGRRHGLELAVGKKENPQATSPNKSDGSKDGKLPIPQFLHGNEPQYIRWVRVAF